MNVRARFGNLFGHSGEIEATISRLPRRSHHRRVSNFSMGISHHTCSFTAALLIFSGIFLT